MDLIATRRRLLMVMGGGASSGVTANTTPTPEITYVTNLSAITAPQLKTYSQAISNNPLITNRTKDVYINDSINGAYYKISVGATKAMIIDNTSYDWLVLGFNHDTMTSLTFYGKATATGKAGITWQMKRCEQTLRSMHNSDTNSVGWTSCLMRTNVCASTYNKFSFKSCVCPVNKLTLRGNQSSVITTTSDTMFLPSYVEVLRGVSDEYKGEGEQYMYFYSGGSEIKDRGTPPEATLWWLRTPYSDNTKNYMLIWRDGGSSNARATQQMGAAYAFCS